MIKRCPSCSRTYSDESISFCLADGALLSAPYEASKEEAPATEVLPSVHVDVPPTQPAKRLSRLEKLRLEQEEREKAAKGGSTAPPPKK